LSYGLEWLGQIIIRANTAGLRFIKWLERAYEKHYRDMAKPLVPFNVLADLVATASRHENIREHYVGLKFFQLRNSLLAVADGRDLYPFIREGQANHLLNGDGIVRKQQFASRDQIANSFEN
jgi:hypothetical protein